jgi:hypothetical protein
MIVSGIGNFTRPTPPSSNAEPPFEHSELDQTQPSPPLLFSAPDGSILVASGSSYTSICEQTTSSPEFLGGDLTAVRPQSSSFYYV